ncbi:ATP-binding protein [bacterium AH-315-P13]|nr:ATP-binding protein [bacterium AH-315-P13]
MKKFTISFLFSSLFLVLFFIMKKSEAQNHVDSLNYYVDIVKNSKSNDSLIKAFNYLQKQRLTNKKLGNSLGEAYNLIYIARIQRKIGALNDSENSAIEALELLDNLENDKYSTKYKLTIYNDLGILYKELSMYNQSLEYYNRILKIAELQNKATILNNIGNVYLMQGNYNKAISYYSISYMSSLNYKDNKAIARAQDNLGFAQSKIEHPDALKNMMGALNIRIEQDYEQGIITSYLHLSQYYIDRKDKESGLIYINKALDIADSSKNIKYKKNVLSLLLEINEDSRIIEYKRINDSISKSERVAKNEYASIIYDFDKEAKRANENELQMEREKSKRILYQALGVFVLLLSILAYFKIKSRHKKETIQQVYNTETRISKKVHDEVANDVYQVMIKLQADHNSNNEALLDDLENVYIKTREISKENSAIDFKEDFKNILNDLLLGYNGDNVSVVTRDLNIINWKAKSNLSKTVIYRVLQELMTNMRKHSKATIAVLTFKKRASKIIIDYKDNGIGCNLKKQSGLQNAENRITSIKGTINFESEINKGFKAKIVV